MLYTRRTFDFEHPAREADVIVVGLPFDSTQTGRPCRLGPLFVREALRNMEGHDPETGLNPFSSLKFADVGDLDFVPGSWKLTEERIIETVRELKETNNDAFIIGVGGDHLNTLGMVRALRSYHKNLTIVHFDAHRDLLHEWLGEKESHITWARRAAEDGMRLTQIGCRIWKPEEADYAKKHAIQGEESIASVSGPVYVTVDLDVLDPSIAPDVGTPEPVGIALQQLWGMLKDVFSNSHVVGMDVVECAADRPFTSTALAAASIIKKSLAYRITSRAP